MKNGYIIFDKKNDKSLNKLQFLIKKLIKNKYPKFSMNLPELHKIVPRDEVNSLRLYIFNHLNKKFNWEKNISDLCGEKFKNFSRTRYISSIKN